MKLLRILAMSASLAVVTCNGSPTEPSEVHGPEGQGGESGESGSQYATSETATEV